MVMPLPWMEEKTKSWLEFEPGLFDTVDDGIEWNHQHITVMEVGGRFTPAREKGQDIVGKRELLGQQMSRIVVFRVLKFPGLGVNGAHEVHDCLLMMVSGNWIRKQAD